MMHIYNKNFRGGANSRNGVKDVEGAWGKEYSQGSKCKIVRSSNTVGHVIGESAIVDRRIIVEKVEIANLKRSRHPLSLASATKVISL
jgi:hypothetical protein